MISGGNLAEGRRGMAGEEVKKIAQRLNVGAALTTNMCGSGNPSPTAIFGASAHPALTRPVVPPDGSFISAAFLSEV